MRKRKKTINQNIKKQMIDRWISEQYTIGITFLFFLVALIFGSLTYDVENTSLEKIHQTIIYTFILLNMSFMALIIFYLDLIKLINKVMEE